MLIASVNVVEFDFIRFRYRGKQMEIDAERGAAGVPYPIGDGSSPLDHLGKDASQYTPEAAAAMYRQLVGGGAR